LERRGYTSPTVGAWFSSVDFLSFCEALVDNLSAEVVEDAQASAKVGYPVGRIGEVRIWFQHYPTFDDARAAWVKRAARVDPAKVFVVMTDRDGFTLSNLDRFQALPRRKLLLSHAVLPGSEVVYVPGYEQNGRVGDIYDEFERLDHPQVRDRLFALLQDR
jgi:uncharacterized protein (DUF1919 family)